MGATINIVSAQTVLKVGDNPSMISSRSAVLEIESTNKGFLPPRMTKAQRNAISKPAIGLIIWCTDCNSSGNQKSGELFAWLGARGWVPFSFLTSSGLTTGKKADANKPVKLGAAGASIFGTLESIYGDIPTETGIVYREIMSNDFARVPVLDALGNADTPTYKAVGALVTTVGSAISVNIPALSSTTGSIRPYYFRTYAKSPSGIGYGNTVVFNIAPPSFSTPVVSNADSMAPVWNTTLTVNAGTPKGTVTEYGYCSSTVKTMPTILDNKIPFSKTPAGIASLADLNKKLDSENFTSDPIIPVALTDYLVREGTNYIRFYVTTADGTTTYSNLISFVPPVATIAGYTCTGGTATGIITPREKLEGVTQTIKVNVTKAGTYSISTDTVYGVSFSGSGVFLESQKGEQVVTLTASGIPVFPEGTTNFTMNVASGACSFTGNLTAPVVTDAICNGGNETKIVYVTSKTGKTWMDRNLGASRIARTTTDYKAYGCLYQWGRGNDGHASITWKKYDFGVGKNGVDYSQATFVPGGHDPTNFFVLARIADPGRDWRSPSNDNLWQGVSGINNPCPTTYRLPTITELEHEITDYGITDTSTADKSPLKFTFPGFRTNIDGSVVNPGTEVHYWTSTVGLDSKISTRFIDNHRSVFDAASARSMGYSVRCISDVNRDAVSGDDAVATVGIIEPIAKQLVYNEVAATTNFIRVHFNVTKAGKYDSFVASDPTGLTKGLSLAAVPAGRFATIGDNWLDFVVVGTPTGSLAGNSFAVSRIETPLQTGIILPNSVSGGTAIATVTSVENIVPTSPFKIGVAGSGTIKVNFNVTGPGTYAGFVSQFTNGATTGLGVATIPTGSFAVGNQSLTFTISGTPLTSVDGNSFIISRIGTPLNTGTILPDPVTGGSSVATVTAVDRISDDFRMGMPANNTIKVHFNVSSPGTYDSFVTTATSGATSGLYVAPVTADSFTATGDQTLDFAVSGIAATSVEGNSFTISRITQPLKTGKILPAAAVNAICDGTRETTVEPFTSVTSKVWMDRNLGASRAAVSMDDYKAYGCLYQWGRGNDGHASITWESGTKGTAVNAKTNITSDTPGKEFITTTSFPYDWRATRKDDLWSGISANTNPCPSGYRLPTNVELTKEITDNAITNARTAYSSPFKFPSSGFRNYTDGSFLVVGQASIIWTSSSPANARNSFGRALEDSTYEQDIVRAYGCSVRCIQN